MVARSCPFAGNGFEGKYKRVFQLYLQPGLPVRKRTQRRAQSVGREPPTLPLHSIEVRSMDSVMDALASGRRLETLTIVEDHSNGAVNVVIEQAISGRRVEWALDKVSCFCG